MIDPANNSNRKMDVAVIDRKIALVEADIPATDAKRTLDVSGLYVTPGLIDMHEHVFHSFNFLGWVEPIRADDFCFPFGVTTVVNAGTSGAESFEDFKKIIDHSRTRILAYLNCKIFKPFFSRPYLQQQRFFSLHRYIFNPVRICWIQACDLTPL